MILKLFRSCKPQRSTLKAPMRLSCLLALLLILLLPTKGAAQAVISEFMADNSTTIADNFGNFPDWIEIHNPSSQPIDLTDWSLTDNAADLTKWRFPTITLAPGEFRVVWASNLNLRDPAAPLHTNFALSKSGEYLALVRPDGTTIEHQFAPAFPPQETDGSWGLRFDSTVHVAASATFSYRIPSSISNPGPNWASPTFNSNTWATGPSGFGFGLTVPGITVRHVFKNGGIGGLTDAANLVLLPDSDPQVSSSATVVLPTVNILGEGADGRYGNNTPPPAGIGDQYAIRGTGFVQIITPGNYTFGLNSDDGGRIRINGNNVMVDDTFHGPQDHFGTISLSAGWHEFEIIMFEGGGGDCVEFFAAPGIRTSFDAAAFRLVGDVANGGLAAATLPNGTGSIIATNIQTAMSGRTSAYFRTTPAGSPGAATSLSLVMRANDGFAAFLNGNEIARDNTPQTLAWNSAAVTPLSTEASLQKRGFNVTSALPSLSAPSPLLAIQGMRTSTSDTGFLIIPELISGRIANDPGPALYAGNLATPGWINGPISSLGPVAEVSFSIQRGIFTAPVSLALTTTTPGATIRYTTNGSTPSATTGTLYTTPLTISSTTVIRAVAYKPDFDNSPVSTHTYLFPNDVITQSANGSAPPGWPSSSGTSQVLDYGMDPEIVNHANPQIGGQTQVKNALLALPSVIITTDLPNLFNIGGSRGIYANPYDRGISAERPASLEWINPPTLENTNGTSEFQINAGLRIRGGFSRSTDNPKHALRFLFRSEYGAAKLNYPLFGDQGASVFDKIDFRTSQNYSWSFLNDDQNTFLREESSRQAFLDMGQPGSHVRYVHLYINGQYWGLFNLDERTEADFAATYYGGTKEEYDVVKAEQDSNYTTQAVEGNIDAWNALWNLAKTHRANPTNQNYFRMQGLAADGVTPTADPVLLDADNLIDYLMTTFWTGNFDGATSAFLGNDRANNWSASRRRDNNPGQGFRFYVHDFEHSLFNVNEDRTGPFPSANESNFSYANPMFLHQDLTGNAEYRMRWADRAHRHLFNGGALTTQAWLDRVNTFATIVDTSIIAESARWGDAKNPIPKTRLTWQNARNDLLSYLPQRGPVVLNQLRNDGLYPSIDAPVPTPNSGAVAVNTPIAITGPPSAEIYYMPDGSDPRAIGGALRPGAQLYVSSTSSEELVPWSATGWRYLSPATNLGTTWRATAFNDTAWPTGTAEIGYGDGDESTAIPTPPNPKPAAAYFRKSFTISNLSEITSLNLSVEYDDSFAVYINGTRVAGNLPTNPASSLYFGSPIEDTIENFTLDATTLIAGNNVVAVEVHQSNETSSDLSMNLSLTANRQNSSTALVLNQPGITTLRLRAKNGATWSALQESVYQVSLIQPSPANLIISELSYNPPAPHDLAEFLELWNADPVSALDLSGARFTNGIDFTFPDGTTLAPNSRIILVRNAAAFETLYGTSIPIAGVFENNTALSNSGERIRIETSTGITLVDFTYGTSFPWQDYASDLGRSIVLTNPANPNSPDSWRPSATDFGNPSTSDSITLQPGQNLLTYALDGTSPTFDPSTGIFTIDRRLGADDVILIAEWSDNLTTWTQTGLTKVSETATSPNRSTLNYSLTPLPPTQAFLRLRITTP
jgi:hypothetical protein